MTAPDDDSQHEVPPRDESPSADTDDVNPPTPPPLAARRAAAMQEAGQGAAELIARVEEQTRGYREVSERIAKAIQPAIDIQESFARSLPKIDTSALMPKVSLGLEQHLEHLRPAEPVRALPGRYFEELQDQLEAEAEERAREQEEWDREQEELAAELAADRQRRDEIETARHDAMLSTLQTMSGAMGSVSVTMSELLSETRQTSRLQGGTFLVAVGALLAAVVVPVALTSWSALDEWGRAGMLALLVVASGLVTWGLNRRYRG